MLRDLTKRPTPQAAAHLLQVLTLPNVQCVGPGERDGRKAVGRHGVLHAALSSWTANCLAAHVAGHVQSAASQLSTRNHGSCKTCEFTCQTTHVWGVGEIFRAPGYALLKATQIYSTRTASAHFSGAGALKRTENSCEAMEGPYTTWPRSSEKPIHTTGTRAFGFASPRSRAQHLHSKQRP